MNDRVWTSSEVSATAPGSTGAPRSQVSVSSRSDRTPRLRHPIRCPHSSPAPCAGRATRVRHARRHRTYCAGAARHYLIGRYYDPQSGQFLSVDPKVQQTQQAFSYVGDDPVQLTDPSGGTTIGLAGGYLPDYAQCGDSDDVGSDQWRQCTQLNAEGYGSMAVGQTSVNLFAAFDSAWHVANRVWDASGGKLVHWVKEHPADAIEITLAVASVATGGISMLGDFVTLPDLLAGNLPAIGEFASRWSGFDRP